MEKHKSLDIYETVRYFNSGAGRQIVRKKFNYRHSHNYPAVEIYGASSLNVRPTMEEYWFNGKRSRKNRTNMLSSCSIRRSSMTFRHNNEYFSNTNECHFNQHKYKGARNVLMNTTFVRNVDPLTGKTVGGGSGEDYNHIGMMYRLDTEANQSIPEGKSKWIASNLVYRKSICAYEGTFENVNNLKILHVTFDGPDSTWKDSLYYEIIISYVHQNIRKYSISINKKSRGSTQLDTVDTIENLEEIDICSNLVKLRMTLGIIPEVDEALSLIREIFDAPVQYLKNNSPIDELNENIPDVFKL